MEYEITVRFKRSYEDDANVIGKANPSPEEFAIQLAKELQASNDDLGMAGSFQIETVSIGNETHLIR